MIVKEDKRENLALTCSLPGLSTAPLSIVIVLDVEKTRPEGNDDFSGKEYRWLWYHEGAACAYNVLLESTAWSLSSNMFTIENKDSVCSLLGLESAIYDPLFVIPVGN